MVIDYTQSWHDTSPTIIKGRVERMRPAKTTLSSALAILLATASALPSQECCDIPILPSPAAASQLAQTLPANAQSVSLDWPVSDNPVLNSPFGPRQLGSQQARYDWHRGLDIKLPMDTPLYAPAHALVLHAGPHPGYSDTIIQLQHNTEEPILHTLYLHLSSVGVSEGDTVEQGEFIGYSGQGSATYPHLHWEVRLDCLRRRCCESVYTYLDYENQLPPAPALEAVGSGGPLGGMVLLSADFPKTEIDLQTVELQWWTDRITARLNTLNGLTPTGDEYLLDDPLFFHEETGARFVFLPQRFNSSYDSADYQILFFGLDDSTASGTALISDGGGLSSQSTINPEPPPLALEALHPSYLVRPGGEVDLRFRITNNNSSSHSINMTGISAQSLDVAVEPDSALLHSGESITVEVSASLSGQWPEDIGDLILLRVEAEGGEFTDLIGASFIETSDEAAQAGLWVIE